GALPQLAVGDLGTADLEDRGRPRVAFEARFEHRDQRVGTVEVARAAIGAALDPLLLKWVAAAWQWLGQCALPLSLAGMRARRARPPCSSGRAYAERRRHGACRSDTGVSSAAEDGTLERPRRGAGPLGAPRALEPAGCDLLDRAVSAHGHRPERLLERSHVELGFAEPARGQPVQLARPEDELILIARQRECLAPGRRAGSGCQQHHLSLALQTRA